MNSMRIVPFTADHLDGAARLLALRQSRLRANEPSLPAAFEDPVHARLALADELAVAGWHGTAALADERLVGYLVGAPLIGSRWDRAAWIDLVGHAVDPSVGGQLASDLYAAWARRMIELGIFSHMVQIPSAEPDLLAAWYALGFGQMHVAGIRSTDPTDLGPPDPAIVVRRALAADRDSVLSFADLLGRHQAQSPSFSPYLPEQVEADRLDWAEELDGEDNVWLAVEAGGGRAMGISVSYPQDPGPMVPVRAVRLAATMSRPDARRGGVGRALLRQVLTDARDRGIGWCFSDWRSTNLEASRAWPALGFRVVYLRLRREIDPRIAWAHGRKIDPGASV